MDDAAKKYDKKMSRYFRLREKAAVEPTDICDLYERKDGE